MIKLTKLDGAEIFLNPDHIEILEETPDTHVTLSNGKNYLFREPACVVIDRIVAYRARILRRAATPPTKKYLGKTTPSRYLPASKP
ncbi:flagellar FlbD family protein [Geomesophilobacter sediminis]|uniref:Flagellar FlbD family protein n=1 Tax=Geomesophilobacter sediminis TaxID=2798584 RepID=A0A8J7LYC9_9BACT|nr:flagellar FlbD family protein [Geomesophilobacter sediminis]MBJ6724846.1 flagellar FlbD family protein [Geomesophilobacter sediminis]